MTTSPAKQLARIAQLTDRRRRDASDIDRLACQLRTPGLDGYCAVTWQQLADALGIGKSAAQERYAHLSWMAGGPDPVEEGTS
jgi:hypothetical protein